LYDIKTRWKNQGKFFKNLKNLQIFFTPPPTLKKSRETRNKSNMRPKARKMSKPPIICQILAKSDHWSPYGPKGIQNRRAGFFGAGKTIFPSILSSPLLFWQICVIYSVLFGRYE